MGIFIGATIITEKRTYGDPAGFGYVELIAGLILLLWDPVIVAVDNWVIQLRHRERDKLPQYVFGMFFAFDDSLAPVL